MSHYIKKHLGAALLLMTLILVVGSLLILVYQARYSAAEMKTSGNQYQNIQAYEAAEAGLEYALAFFQTNSSTILAAAVAGAITYTIGPTTLANNSKYTVVITNPTTSNYTLFNVVSTGTSADATAVRAVRQKFGLVSNTITASAISGGNISLVGGSNLNNTITNINIETGGTLNINNGAYTTTSSGTTTTQGNIGSDVLQNVPSLSGVSEATFFQNLFGSPEATIQANAVTSGTYYNNSVAGGDYSQTLKNMSGVTIFITQSSVSLGQGVTIGTSANPVTIIVEGDLTVANGVTIYGFVYSSGPSAGFNLAGGAKIIGGIASAGAMNISNGFILDFVQVPLAPGSASAYVRVPGSWRDF